MVKPRRASLVSIKGGRRCSFERSVMNCRANSVVKPRIEGPTQRALASACRSQRDTSCMALTSELTPEADLLIVRVGGERPYHDADAMEEIAELWMRVADCCRERGIRRVLTLVSIESAGSSALAHWFFSHLESLGFERGIRTALVFSRQKLRRVNELGVGVAARMGWDIEAFDDEQQARRWLNAPPLP